MNQSPILSIITVTKNCSGTLLRTLESIKEVKSPDIEYVVIDGLSSDGTLEILNQYNPLIDLVISESDDGIYDAMNKGVNLSSGEYVLFLNGDDQIYPENFNQVVQFLYRQDADIFCAQTLANNLDGSSNFLKANKWFLPFFNSVPHPSSFVKRKLLRKYPFNQDLKIASDYDLFLRLFLSGRSFKVLNIVSAIHHRGGASGDIARSRAEVRLIRRDRLGIFFYLFETILIIKNFLKILRVFSRHDGK